MEAGCTGCTCRNATLLEIICNGSIGQFWQDCSAPSKKLACGAVDKKSFKMTSLEPLARIEYNFTEKCLIMPSATTIPSNSMSTRAVDNKLVKTTSGPEPLVQIQNNFRAMFFIMPSTKIDQMAPLRQNSR